ncbi:helix-turn-helix transcriptional regulator [Phytoactinopolyspora halotolerans]|uniref:YafY family transcriptional regulator n=1 Tax=Phytoactinopolyspora halotolerans TaxID=1981512 RepID=A0A6L9S8X8_9ACTN|nr:YafY family protein [Phytoactinopolyspora halotolerans]NEE01141.1 YafY family transcriptional regulator [Phytoactinopolyspora halotolerans]
MLETSARLLRLLSLLQLRREWTGAELASRLDVTARTIRNDIDKLRSLGYPVNATPGVAGGYQLGAGADLPPLLLDDDEAVAVAVGLRTAATGTIEGIEESSVRALAKLEQVLPPRLRRRVDALNTHTVSVPYDSPAPSVDAEILATLSLACRDRERVRFDYHNHQGEPSKRAGEPYRLVRWGRRWYLVAWDIDRSDWRTFRVDRIASCTAVGARFTPRELPDEDLARYVSRQVNVAPRRYQAELLLEAPAETIQSRLHTSVGTVRSVDENRCVLHTANDSLEQLAVHVALLGVDFEVIDPPELVEHFRGLSARYAKASRP